MIAIDRILVPIDFSEFSRRALEYGVALGTYYEAAVTALHVYALPTGPTVAPSMGIGGIAGPSLRAVDASAVTAAAERLCAGVAGSDRVGLRVVEAPDTCDEILVHAEALDVSLLVMGSHGHSGFNRLILGSTAGKVLRKSARPVMVVPPHADGGGAEVTLPFKRVLCPIDFSDGSLRALEFALRLAQEDNARLTLLHAIELPSDWHELSLPNGVTVADLREAAAADCRQRLAALVPASVSPYCSVETRVVEGKAHRRILEAASDDRSDLIVMGVLGRGALDLTLFGSTTLHVVHGAVAPVLTVRA